MARSVDNWPTVGWQAWRLPSGGVCFRSSVGANCKSSRECTASLRSQPLGQWGQVSSLRGLSRRSCRYTSSFHRSWRCFLLFCRLLMAWSSWFMTGSAMNDIVIRASTRSLWGLLCTQCDYGSVFDCVSARLHGFRGHAPCICTSLVPLGHTWCKRLLEVDS